MRTEENKNKDIVIAGVELYPPMKCAHRLNVFVILKKPFFWSLWNKNTAAHIFSVCFPFAKAKQMKI